MSITSALGRGLVRRWTLRRAIAAALLLVLALGWWTLLRPSALGGPLTLVTVTGVSMEPGLHTGDLAVVHKRGGYEVGEVIAFRSEPVPGKPGGAYVIHRIASGDSTNGYVTRGDNNDWDDPWDTTNDQVAGEMLFSVPDLGSGVRWLAQPVHLGAILAALVSGLTMVGGRPTKPEGEIVEPAGSEETATL